MRVWMREIRHCKGWSQKKAANESGLSPSFYADVERGFRNPSPQNAQAIASALGFDWTLFFTQKIRETSRKEA
jgi:transcriptional regulator with XRE-family HTH domain